MTGPPFGFLHAGVILLCFGAASCGPPDMRAQDPFSATGELIALSGGDAGPNGACISCHGLSGEGNGSGVPRIAGLGLGYLSRQMEFYDAGLRRNDEMQRIASRLNGEEQQAVAAYYAGMRFEAGETAPRTAPALYARGDPARRLPSCASCHGVQGEGVGPGNPPLAGQPAAYLADQLRQWREGKRRGDPYNLMLAISQRLTPAEIDRLASYASGLDGRSARPPLRAASR